MTREEHIKQAEGEARNLLGRIATDNRTLLEWLVRWDAHTEGEDVGPKLAGLSLISYQIDGMVADAWGMFGEIKEREERGKDGSHG